jgi:hypothetical protein
MLPSPKQKEEVRNRHQNPHYPAPIPPPSLDFMLLALNLRGLFFAPRVISKGTNVTP